MRSVVLAILLLIPSVGIAQTPLVINAPETAKVGKPFTVDHVGSTMSAVAWIMPPEHMMENATVFRCDCDTGGQMLLIVEKPGLYRFVLHGTDGKTLQYVEHVITVTGQSSPPTDPNPPTNPDPNPSLDLAKIEKQSSELATSVKDATTRLRLYDAMKSDDYGGDFEEAQTRVEKLFTKVLAGRKGESKDSDWWNGWYIPMLKTIEALANKGEIKTIADYNKVVSAFVKGLK